MPRKDKVLMLDARELSLSNGKSEMPVSVPVVVIEVAHICAKIMECDEEGNLQNEKKWE